MNLGSEKVKEKTTKQKKKENAKTQEETRYFLKIEHFPKSSLEAKYFLN